MNANTGMQQQHMLEYIRSELGGRSEVVLDVDVPLVSSGLVDSLALVGILLKLEEITGLSIPTAKVQPKDLETVRMMFAMAQRLGRS